MFTCGSREQMKAGLKLESFPNAGLSSDQASQAVKASSLNPLLRHHTTRLHRDPPI